MYYMSPATTITVMAFGFLGVGMNCNTAVQTGYDTLFLFVSVLHFFYFVTLYYKEGKVIPLQVWTGPDGSSRLRLSDFKTIGT